MCLSLYTLQDELRRMSGFVIESADVYLCLLTLVLVNAVVFTIELWWLQTQLETSPGVQVITVQLM